MSDQELIIVRGLPGSGKSTFADRYADMYSFEFHDMRHIETDMFFTSLGVYTFEPDKLSEAHKWAQEWCWNILRQGDSVIVSNTFSRIREMQSYIDMAKEFDAKLTVLECQGNYGSVHNVPEETIQKMKDRWERYPKEPQPVHIEHRGNMDY